MSSDLVFAAGDVRAPLTVKLSATAKAMRLRVDPRTGAVVLTLPRRASRRRAIEWAAGQRPWVEMMLARLPMPVAIGPGASIPFRGEPHEIVWQAGSARRVERQEDRIVLGGPAESLEPRLLRWLRGQALDLLTSDTMHYAAKAGVTVTRVGVGDPVSRWGSCSASGAIRYSWRLILAPDFVRRATVAHEVAHRVHMNHGPEFHGLVRTLFGEDPGLARDWLRREGASLHQVGRRT